MTLKDKVDSWLCEQGFVLTHMDNNYLRFDNVGINPDTSFLETDVLIIKNKSRNNIPYSDYWVISYQECENSSYKTLLHLSKDILKRIESILNTYRGE